MELEELTALEGSPKRTVSVSVPARLLEALDHEPQCFGLSAGLSRRQALLHLVRRGMYDAFYEQRERERRETYERLHADSEWREAAEEAHVEAVADGLI